MPVNFAVKAAVTVALTAANMALTMTRKIEGPRLDELKFSSGDYGAPLAMIWGLRRMDAPIFWAEDLREVRRRRKTKGGKFNEYTYYGTWAVALAGHEIEGVTRIWFDTHLVYDLTGAGPVTPFDFGDNATGSIADYITIYTGTETQDPDPRIEATVEAQFGEGSCPAYRGTAYVVFKDIPLEKLGNRIPQVSVEVVSLASPAYPFETLDIDTAQPNRLWGATFSSDYSRFMWSNGTTFEMWDVAARQRIVSGTLPVEINLSAKLGLYNDGRFLAVASNNEDLVTFTADGKSASVQADIFPNIVFDQRWQQEVRVLTDQGGVEHWMTIPLSTIPYWFFDGIERTMLESTGITWTPFHYFNDDTGAIWAVGRVTSSGATTAYFYRVAGTGAGPDLVAVTGLPAIGSAVGDVSAIYSGGAFVLAWAASGNNRLYRIDPLTGAILTTRTGLTFDAFNFEKQFANFPPAAPSIWLNLVEVDLTTLATIRTVTVGDWISTDADGIIFDPINNALWTAPQFDQEINVLYLDRISSDGVTLASICADVAEDCGVQDYDFTALDQTIAGWSATRGAGSSILEPLLDAYDSDIRPHDFTIEGVRRTGTATGSTLETERFVGEPRYAVSIRQSSELPRALMIDFADIDAEQQPNSVRSDRPLDATDARGEKKIDLTTLALGTDEARGLADRHFRRIWNERQGISLSLTAEALALEPGDVRTLSLDGQEVIARCVRVNVGADDVLATEWLYDSPSLALLNGSTGATFDGRTPSVIVVPGYSKGFVLDIPLLADSDEITAPQVYALAGPYGDGAWPGATIFQAIDGEFSDELASVPTSSAATWGYVSAAMAYANPNLWDRGTAITVTLQTGELTGCTEAAANADPTLNLAAIGVEGRWEIVQFTTATLTTGTTYTVSGFKRGRRGTEWAAELHAAGDVFVLLDTADPEAMGLSEVATAVSFKAITAGRSNGFEINFTYEGQTLKPYAPTHLSAVKETSGDWTISAVRRTRVGGAWRGGVTIPLSEASESYRVTVGDGVTSVNKTTASLPYTWTVADQTTDTGAEVMAGDLEYAVAQISTAVGAGFVSEATA